MESQGAAAIRDKRVVEIRANPNKTYTITTRNGPAKDGVVVDLKVPSCTCRTFRGAVLGKKKRTIPGRTCWHIRAVRDHLVGQKEGK